MLFDNYFKQVDIYKKLLTKTANQPTNQQSNEKWNCFKLSHWFSVRDLLYLPIHFPLLLLFNFPLAPDRFGIALQKGRMFDPSVIQGQLLLQDFTMMQ